MLKNHSQQFRTWLELEYSLSPESFLYATTKPFSKGRYLVMLVGRKAPGGTPTGQVGGGWLISHLPFPSCQKHPELAKAYM